MSALPKPQLRGYLKRHIIKTMIGSFIFASASSTFYYFYHVKPKMDAYAEFARTYNGEEHLKFLIKYGYMKSSAQ